MNLFPNLSQLVYKRCKRLVSVLALMVVIIALFELPAAGPPLLYAKENAQEDAQTGGYYYTVKVGDSWRKIASQTGISMGELQLVNPQAIRMNYWLRTGERLFIPTGQQTDENANAGEPRYHIVQPGEFWALIAERNGVTTTELLNANPRSIRAGSVLYTGERLLIPGTGDASATAEDPAAEEAPTDEAASEEGADEESAPEEAEVAAEEEAPAEEGAAEEAAPEEAEAAAEEEAATEEAPAEEEATEEAAPEEAEVAAEEEPAEEAAPEEAEAAAEEEAATDEAEAAAEEEAPAEEPATEEPEAESTAPTSATHKVGPGEYWSLIAGKYNVSINDLVAANPQSVRAGYVLYSGETLTIPGAEISAEGEPVTITTDEAAEAPATEEDATATEEGATEESAAEEEAATEEEAAEEGTAADAEATAEGTPAAEEEASEAVSEEVSEEAAEETSAETPAAEEEATEEETTDAATDAAADAASVSAECPADFADYPAQITNVLNAAGNAGADALSSYLQSCQALSAFESNDWTGDDLTDVVVVYANPGGENAFVENDLLIYNGTESGFELGYHARAAGEVSLLSLVDMNGDEQPDVSWIDTTCGASTCFATVNIRSWDGTAWEDWTDGAITMAYPEVTLEDVNEETTGLEIVLNGGLYGSVGAGPQRARVEVWGSADGAPYAVQSRTYNASECLYHVVLDANTALQSDGKGLAEAATLYAQATSDDSLKSCWVRPDEVEELRSFSFFRQALVAANMDDADGAAQAVADLSAQYPDSVYDQLTQAWYAEYEASGDLQSACAVANQFAEENPEAWEMLADYGYTNPTFSAPQVCPDLSAAAAAAATDETATDETAADETTTAEGDAAATDEAATDAAAESDDAAADESATDETAIAEGDEAATDEAVADDTATDEAATDAEVADEGADTVACPDTLDGYPEAAATILASAAGDAAAVEAWLSDCDALADDRGAVLMEDLNGDDVDDAVLFPTIISDVGFGPDGAQGLVLIYHGQDDGTYTLAAQPETFGKPSPIQIDDLNADGNTDIAWTVEGCSTFCVTEVQMLSWDGEEYVVNIAPGATIAEGQATFSPVADADPGQGNALVLTGGVSGTPDSGLDVSHEENWQSIDGGAYQRISWTYDREADGGNCLGLRLVEADVALRAGPAIGYDEAVQKYSDAINPSLEACSIFGASPEEEMVALQGLASFRLIQSQALSGDVEAATNTLTAFSKGQPDGLYTSAAQQWLDAYNDSGDEAAACAGVQSIFEDNPELWQITDQFGFNHPALAAEQICFVP